MSDTRSIIAASISNIRQDGPADGGPEPSAPEPAASDDQGAADDTATGFIDEPGDDDPGPVTSDDDTDGVAGDPPPAAPVPEPVTPDPKPEDKATDNDDFDKEPEKIRDKNGREVVNRIPQPRVKRMVENAVKKAEAAKDEAHAATTGALRKQLDEFETYGVVMATDPERFMSMLAAAYPAYQQYAKGAAQPAAALPDEASDPMPQPDGRLGDGTPAYTDKGWAAYNDWKDRQVERRVMAKVGEKYKYLDDQKAAEDARAAAVPRIRQQIADATEHWEGFKDHADAILTELRNDTAGRLSLHDAYRVVMLRNIAAEREGWAKERETLKTDRNKLREEILAEINKRPVSTGAVPGAPPVAAASTPTGPRSTRDIIAEAARTLRTGRAA